MRVFTLKEAAEHLGFIGGGAPRRLQRLLLALEEQTGQQILIRLGREGRGRRYRIPEDRLLSLREETRTRLEVQALTQRIAELESSLRPGINGDPS